MMFWRTIEREAGRFAYKSICIHRGRFADTTLVDSHTKKSFAYVSNFEVIFYTANITQGGEYQVFRVFRRGQRVIIVWGTDRSCPSRHTAEVSQEQASWWRGLYPSLYQLISGAYISIGNLYFFKQFWCYRKESKWWHQQSGNLVLQEWTDHQSQKREVRGDDLRNCTKVESSPR